jgi:hypothetical protein
MTGSTSARSSGGLPDRFDLDHQMSRYDLRQTLSPRWS